MQFNKWFALSSLLCFFAGAGTWFSIRSGAVVTAAGKNLDSGQIVDSDSFVDPSIPSTAFTPGDVVRMQVESMRSAVDDPDQLRVCYSLAAPSNRAHTGPIERFSAMLAAPPYNSLATSPRWQVGEAQFEGNFAALLVTTVDDDLAPEAFHFLLERQSEAPYEDCWMTVAVQYVHVDPLETASTKLQDLRREY
ncbi:MAG: hypothetical protein KDB22_20925 [Planctomycetales bacterium]|nr:hypothetical protein [Planctomycetales bacterium]